MAEHTKEGRLIPIDKWESYHDWPTAAALRAMVFRRGDNGASAWIVRPPGSRRILVDEAAFWRWARGKSDANAPSRPSDAA